jgi:hypothetical protein
MDVTAAQDGLTGFEQKVGLSDSGIADLMGNEVTEVFEPWGVQLTKHMAHAVDHTQCPICGWDLLSMSYAKGDFSLFVGFAPFEKPEFFRGDSDYDKIGLLIIKCPGKCEHRFRHNPTYFTAHVRRALVPKYEVLMNKSWPRKPTKHAA